MQIMRIGVALRTLCFKRFSLMGYCERRQATIASIDQLLCPHTGNQLNMQMAASDDELVDDSGCYPRGVAGVEEDSAFSANRLRFRNRFACNPIGRLAVRKGPVV